MAKGKPQQKWFARWGGYAGALVVLLVALILIPWKTAKIVILFGAVAVQLVYTLRKKKPSPIRAFSNLYEWAAAIVLFLFATAYASLAVKEFAITIIAIAVVVLVMTLEGLIGSLMWLWKSNSLLLIILSYVAVSYSVIVTFMVAYLATGVTYTVTGGCASSGVFDQTGAVVKNIWDNMYFSSSVFYSTTFGDMVPRGYAKLLTQVELMFSAIIHVILLGLLIPRLKLDNQKRTAPHQKR